MEFPIRTIVRTLDTRLTHHRPQPMIAQSSGDPPYEPQHAHSHRQYSPIQATTQGMLVFIRHPEPQLKGCHSEPQLKECHMFTLYLEPQLKEHSNKSIFKVSPKALYTMHIQSIQKCCLCIIVWHCSKVARQNSVLDRLAKPHYR